MVVKVLLLLSFIVFYSPEITSVIKSTVQFSCFNHFQVISIKCLVLACRRDVEFEGSVWSSCPLINVSPLDDLCWREAVYWFRRLGVMQTWFLWQCYHLWPWANDLAAQRFHFFFCKMGILIIRIQWDNMYQTFGSVLAHRNDSINGRGTLLKYQKPPFFCTARHKKAIFDPAQG